MPAENPVRNQLAIYGVSWSLLNIGMPLALCVCAICKHSGLLGLPSMYVGKKIRLWALISNIPTASQLHFSIPPKHILQRSMWDSSVLRQFLQDLGVFSSTQSWDSIQAIQISKFRTILLEKEKQTWKTYSKIPLANTLLGFPWF